MKHTKYLLILLATCLSSIIFAQQAELSFDTEVDCNNNTYCATIGLKALETNEFKIGTSSIFVQYNKDALAFNSYQSINFDKSNTCISNEFSPYDEHQYDAAIPGIINTTMTLTVEDFACPVVNNNGVDIAKICFNILEYEANSNLTFKARHTNFNRGQAEIELLDGVNMINKNEVINCKTSTSSNSIESANVTSFDVNPNPIKDFINIEMNATNNEEITISVFDVKGRTLKTINEKVANGSNQIKINASDLPQGIYLLDVNGDETNLTMKLIKE